MIDFDKIRQKATELMGDAYKKIKQYTPEAFSKEKKFVNAIVGSLALITMADKKAETNEVITSIDFIKDIQEIQDLDMVKDAIELYEFHLERLAEYVNNDVKFVMEVAKLLADIGKIKDYPEYPPMIESLIEYVAKSDGNTNPLEVEMQEKIRKAIK